MKKTLLAAALCAATAPGLASAQPVEATALTTADFAIIGGVTLLALGALSGSSSGGTTTTTTTTTTGGGS